jgi:hypothetical protein
MHFHDEENEISYGREQVRDTTVTQTVNAGGTVEEKKSEKAAIRGNLKSGNCNGKVITDDYPTLDSMSPRVGAPKGNTIQEIFTRY